MSLMCRVFGHKYQIESKSCHCWGTGEGAFGPNDPINNHADWCPIKRPQYKYCKRCLEKRQIPEMTLW